MTARFIHNFDALVTADYLDLRFTDFESRTDHRMVKFESRIDQRFNSLETRLDSKIDKLSSDIEVRFERMEGKFSRIYLMFGLTMVTATIPILQNLFDA